MQENKKGFRIQNGTLLKYYGEEENVVVPEGVLRVSPYAFAENKTLKSIVLPIKLKSVGKGAFFGCDNLAEVTLPGRLYLRAKGGKVFPKEQKIFFRFFATTGDRTADMDYSDVFDNESAYIASGIDDAAKFVEDAEASAKVVQNATVVEPVVDSDTDGASSGNSTKAHISVRTDEPPVDIEDIDPRTLEERMEDIIPEDDEEQDEEHTQVTTLSDYIVESDKVIKYIGSAKVTRVPDFVHYIGADAFSNTEVTEVILPDGVTAIEKNAFAWCVNLKKINLPEGLTLIDDGAFASCQSLENITFPQSLKMIGADAFRACSALRDFALPGGIKTISRRAFDFCVTIENVVIPDGIRTVAEGVFSHCEKLTRVSLGKNIREIDAWAFAECYGLREITFPEGLISIGDVAFINCRSLVAFDLPSSLKRIGRQAFVGCESLHLVTLPARLEPSLKPQKVFYKLSSLSLTFN